MAQAKVIIKAEDNITKAVNFEKNSLSCLVHNSMLTLELSPEK